MCRSGNRRRLVWNGRFVSYIMILYSNMRLKKIIVQSQTRGNQFIIWSRTRVNNLILYSHIVVGYTCEYIHNNIIHLWRHSYCKSCSTSIHVSFAYHRHWPPRRFENIIPINKNKRLPLPIGTYKTSDIPTHVLDHRSPLRRFAWPKYLLQTGTYLNHSNCPGVLRSSNTYPSI